MKRKTPVATTDTSAEKLERAKELYIAGDMIKDEYYTIKASMTAKPEGPVDVVDMAALLGVINMPADAWDHADPVERWRRNKLLLKWVKIRKGKLIGYELTELAKAIFEE